jgi:predicted  nucleic acid-binding Zn-ribbon protein
MKEPVLDIWMPCKTCGELFPRVEVITRMRKICKRCEATRMRKYYAKRTNRIGRLRHMIEEIQRGDNDTNPSA